MCVGQYSVSVQRAKDRTALSWGEPVFAPAWQAVANFLNHHLCSTEKGRVKGAEARLALARRWEICRRPSKSSRQQMEVQGMKSGFAEAREP